MRNALTSILLFVSVLCMGQVSRAYPFQTTPSSPCLGAESRWGCNNNGTDEEGNQSITLYGSASWSTTTPVEGTHCLYANGANYGASIPSINYSSTFTIVGEARKYSGAVAVLWSTMQSNDGWTLVFDPVNDRLGFDSGNGSSTATAYGNDMGEFSGSWFTWMAVVNYDLSTVQFYIDGSDAGSGAITYTPSTYSSTGMLGIRHDDTGDFFGELDAIQLYLGLLTSGNAATINTTPLTEVTYCE